MRVIAKQKLIYDGRIRRANLPFEVKSEDEHLLVDVWGCSVVNEHKRETSKKEAENKEKFFENTPILTDHVSKDVHDEKAVKKARKSPKKKV